MGLVYSDRVDNETKTVTSPLEVPGLLWWLILHITLARPGYPDNMPNVIPDVSVRKHFSDEMDV